MTGALAIGRAIGGAMLFVFGVVALAIIWAICLAALLFDRGDDGGDRI